MHPFFSDQKVEWDKSLPSIFLAGPTPRDLNVASWRAEALRILGELEFKGLVLVPERHNWQIRFDYTDQVEWEHEGLYRSSCVAFWVPRKMTTLPGLTTNVEFGALVGSKNESRRVIYGRPEDSEKNRYLDWFYHRYTGERPCRTLLETLTNAVVLAVAYRMDLQR